MDGISKENQGVRSQKKLEIEPSYGMRLIPLIVPAFDADLYTSIYQFEQFIRPKGAYKGQQRYERKVLSRHGRLIGIHKTFGGIAHQTGQHETTNPICTDPAFDSSTMLLFQEHEIL